jgi:hypothetical protein
MTNLNFKLVEKLQDTIGKMSGNQNRLTIEIYPSKADQAKAYGIYCEKRFRAFGIERREAGVYSGDSDSMEMFTVELWKNKILFMPLVVDGENGVAL